MTVWCVIIEGTLYGVHSSRRKAIEEIRDWYSEDYEGLTDEEIWHDDDRDWIIEPRAIQ